MKTNIIIAFVIFASQLMAQEQKCSQVGMNVHMNVYWGREVPFSNLMMQASPWIPCDEDWTFDLPDNYTFYDKISYNTQGYPTEIPQAVQGLAKRQCVKTVLAWDNGGILPVGTYKILYEGTGSIELYGQDTFNIIRKSNGYIEFLLNPYKSGNPLLESGSLGLLIRSSEALDPVRNIRVLLPGASESDTHYPFNKAFVDKLKPFKALRFMNWIGSYWSEDSLWSDRRQKDYYTQFNMIDWPFAKEKSMAYEYMIQLCNLTGSDLWLSIPFGAGEDYVENLGKLINENLNSGLKVYLEYGNEVWNHGFNYLKQYNYVKENVPSNLAQSDHQYRYVYHANKAFQAFKKYNNHQIIRIIGGHQANPDVMRRSLEGLSFLNIASEFDAGSVTDYAFQQDITNEFNSETQIKDIAAASRRSMGQALQHIEQNKEQLQTLGKELITYEGGFHATTEYDLQNPPPYLQALVDFQKDTSCYNIYTEWMGQIKAITNGALQMAFVLGDNPYSSSGSFGHIENIFTDDASNSPKYRALMDFCLGVDSKEILRENDEVILYPNPASSYLHVESKENQISRIEIMDFLGRVVYFEKGLANLWQISIPNVAKGMYLLKYTIEGKVYQKPIILM